MVRQFDQYMIVVHHKNIVIHPSKNDVLDVAKSPKKHPSEPPIGSFYHERQPETLASCFLTAGQYN